MFETVELKLDKYGELGESILEIINGMFSENEKLENLVYIINNENITYIDKIFIVNSITNEILRFY